MKIAWVGSIAETPALRSASFSRAVLPLLSRLCSIEVFVSETVELQSPLRADGLDIFHYHRLSERCAEMKFDALVYLIEDDWRCNFTRLVAEVWPGLAILFDTNLFDLHLGCLRHTTAPTEIDGLFESRFPDRAPAAPSFGDFHVGDWSSSLYRRRYPFFLESAVATRLYSVFSTRAEKELLEKGVSAENICRLQMKKDSSCDGSVGESAISSSGEIFDFCFTGISLINDRLSMLFSAFEKLVTEGTKFKAAWVLRDATEFELANKILSSEYRKKLRESISLEFVDTDAKLQQVVASSFLPISLRADGAASPGVLAIEAWMQSKRPLVSECSSCADFFAEQMLLLPSGFGEQEFLFELLDLATSEDSRGSLESLAPRVMNYAPIKNSPRQWEGLIRGLFDFLTGRVEFLRSELVSHTQKQQTQQAFFVDKCLSELDEASSEFSGKESSVEANNLRALFMGSSNLS